MSEEEECEKLRKQKVVEVRKKIGSVDEEKEEMV